MSPREVVESLKPLLESAGEDLRDLALGQVRDKHGAGLVSGLDCRLEARLREGLLDLWPGSVVVGEEEGGRAGEWTWWLDPLDGTTNRVHGWPRSAISVALYKDAQAVLAAVRDPYLKETFWAVPDHGAWCGSQRLQASPCRELGKALLCTGLAPMPESQWSVLRDLQAQTRGVRISGCASLDLAYVAAGRVEGFWEIDLKAWDVAAGLVLVREAGGWTSDIAGRTADLDSGDFLACAPHLAQPLLERLAVLAQ